MVWGIGSYEESATDVRKEYRSQIKDFLARVEGRNAKFWKRDTPLESILSWGQNIAEHRQALDSSLNHETEAHRKAQSQIQGFKKALDTAESRYEQLYDENRKMAAQHDNELTNLAIEHSKSLDNWEEKYKLDMAEQKNKYDREADRHKKEMSKLVGQLLVNQRDNDGWTDDKLKLKFRELQRLIEAVASPKVSELKIPPDQQLGPKLDPTDFVGRIGRGKSHYLLKSAMWSIFQEQFFSAPFGFGSLGPGKARTELTSMYSAWRKLFDGSIHHDNDGFAIFYQDREANNWRSATFQCISSEILGTAGYSTASSPLASLSAENVDTAFKRIMNLLADVAKLSNSSIREEVANEVHQMVYIAREIALQFGVHSAQLRLLAPALGEQVQIGEDIQDCADGDYHKGTVYLVDLVTVPGLQKIGDGKADLSSTRTVVPCAIYPAQASSP